MTSTEPETTLSIAAPDRRSLIVRLCAALNEALARHPGWERDCSLVPWQVTSGSFEALPAGIIDSVLHEFHEPASHLQEIEFSGYLETDDGPRAWGFMAVRDRAEPGAGAVVIDGARVTAEEAGYRFEARLRRVSGERGRTDG